MTCEEMIEVRRPWWNSLIMKLVGRSIGCHYLWCHIQSMWRTQSEPLLIDLGNDYFIVKLGGRTEYECALSEGTWLIGDDYLHVQCWKPIFVAELVEITSLAVWVHFPTLHVEFFTEKWLRIIGNQLGRTNLLTTRRSPQQEISLLEVYT